MLSELEEQNVFDYGKARAASSSVSQSMDMDSDVGSLGMAHDGDLLGGAPRRRKEVENQLRNAVEELKLGSEIGVQVKGEVGLSTDAGAGAEAAAGVEGSEMARTSKKTTKLAGRLEG